MTIRGRIAEEQTQTTIRGRFRDWRLTIDFVGAIQIALLKKHLENNGQAIINIGIYTKDSDGTFTRKWGHYANVVAVENNSIKVLDPYDKENEISTWLGIRKNKNIALKNINDNEKYIKTNEAFFINSGINYLEPTEFAVINGIVFIK